MRNRTIIRFFTTIEERSANDLIKVVEDGLKKGHKRFLILISSPGGSVSHGIAIYNYLKGVHAEVETYNFGQVDSIAAVVFAAGKRRHSAPDARFMFHSVTYTPDKRPYNERGIVEILSSLQTDGKNIAKIIADNCDKNPHEIKDLMSEGLTLTAKEAKEMGFVTDITPKITRDLKEEEIIGIG